MSELTFKKVDVPLDPEEHHSKRARDILAEYAAKGKSGQERKLNDAFDEALTAGGIAPGVKSSVVSVEDIVVGKQIRKDVDPESLKELAESIEKDGLLHPPVVVKRPEDGKFELVAGYRRFLAMRNILKRRNIPVTVLPAKKYSEKPRLQIVENLRRKDLKPIEIAEGVGKVFLGLLARAGRDFDTAQSLDTQGIEGGQVHLQFLRKEGFFRYTSRLSEEGQTMLTNLIRATGLSQLSIATCLYLWVQEGRVKEELSKLDLGMSHYSVFMDYGLVGEELLKWARLAHEKGWTKGELKRQLALLKEKEKRKEKPKEQKLLQRIYNFSTTIKRNKALKENPELRKKVVEHLKKLLAELEGS